MISLHILQATLGRGGVCALEVKTQSAKICLNFNIVCVCVCVLDSKCQDLPIFQFGGEGGGVVCSGSQIPKCQDLPKFQRGGGVL